MTDSGIEHLRIVGDDTLLVACDDGHVRMFHLPPRGDPLLVHDLSGADGLVFMSSASDDLSVVAAGTSTGSTVVWRPEESSRPVAEIDGDGYAYGVALTPDGGRLAVSGTDRAVRVYDLTVTTTPRLVTTLVGGTGTTMTLDVDRSGRRLLATLNDGSLVLWNVDDGSYERSAVLDPGADLYNGRFSPDGTHVVAGGANGFALVVPVSPDAAQRALCSTLGQWIGADRWAASLPSGPVADPCP